jgi:DNA invertase Pin-like site-specific DNA recombinase
MKTIIYRRASTDLQAYDQQNRTIQNWLAQNGIKADFEYEEKVSGSKSHKERLLFHVINSCEKGDQIIVSEFSRLSRSMSDAANIVDLCVLSGINIV